MNQAIQTTRKEFDLLMLLASNPGKVFSRKELMSIVWQDEWASSRTVDTHVSMLRGKLGSANPIMTVRGIGYRFGGLIGQPLPTKQANYDTPRKAAQ